MDIRPALPEDACGMSRVLNEIAETTHSAKTSHPNFVLQRYIEHPARIQCSIALDTDARILGFQSLKRAWPENPYGVPVEWGIIGTHISPKAARRGVGAALFKHTLEAAKSASLASIDATIGETNDPGLAFYEALGFTTYRQIEGCICKKLHLEPRQA